MKEIICVHIGQAGVQLSSTVWELFCTEHGIRADGNIKPSADPNSTFQSFFQEVPTGQFVPRAIQVDLEPNVLDEIRAGPYRKLFHPDQLISSYEDAASNFARGHFTLGKDRIEYVLNRIRKIVDMCDGLQGFFLFHSFGGGTGSGFSSLIMERLNVEFTKRIIFEVGVFPGEKMSCAAVEPYNTLLCSTFTIDHTDLTNIFDNESVYNICTNKIDIPRPSFSNLNRIISQLISSLTVSVRFEGFLNADLDQMITNLVPYPRIHFPIFTHAPLESIQRANHQTMTTVEVTRAAFDASNQLINCNMNEGKFMCCCLQFRGKVSPREANDAVFEMKRRTDIKFVDWCPTGFKLGLNNQPPAFVPKAEIARTERSCTMLANSTAIAQRFVSLLNKFIVLYKKRSFVHWYVGEGMEEGDFKNGQDEMTYITNDYNELMISDDDGVTRGEPETLNNTTPAAEETDIEETKEEEEEGEEEEENEEVVSGGESKAKEDSDEEEGDGKEESEENDDEDEDED